MAVYDTYAEIVVENILREVLRSGTAPTLSEILARFDTFTTSNDLSQPLFTADTYQVTVLGSSSAAAYNTGNQLIQQDTQVLYTHMLRLGNKSMESFNRWRQEAEQLEIELSNLEDRIASLLLLADDTAGYFNFVCDNFRDASKIDQTYSTTRFDLSRGLITLGTSNTSTTRIDLSTLDSKDLEFTVLSRNNLISTVSASGSKITNAVSDKSSFWQERIYTNASKPVTIEFKIKLGAPTTISRIDLDLHSSNSGSAVQVVPLYSVDNYNYHQLPSSDLSHLVKDKTSFIFPALTASQIKLVMTKTVCDRIELNKYVYEFGIDEVALFNEGYSTSSSTDTGSIFISQPLSLLDASNTVQQFNRVALEVCETVPDGTTIDYSIMVSNSSPMPASGVYTDIDPLNRTTINKPTTIDFGDLDTVSVSGVLISYDASETNTALINPDKDYHIIQSTSGTTAVISDAIASAKRYNFLNKEDKILSHCVASGIDIADGTLEVWRNINVKGLNTKVRDTTAGWSFNDPYYTTTVYVDSKTGATVDFGSEQIVIDGKAQTGVVNVSSGNHKVQVHKRNWKKIELAGVTTLAALKTADTLYPYNHRYLVEGFSYPADWLEKKVYRGFDIVAEYLMKQVGPFDLLNNVQPTNYEYYALDRDAPDTAVIIDGSTTSKPSMDVFLLKANPSQTDFVNERFLIRFKATNTLYSYMRLKAVMKTTDVSLTPVLDSYRIKVST